MEKQITAVEWLADVYKKRGGLYNSDIEKAKEMEKNQIIDAYNLGQQMEATELFWTKGAFYYNEKYKK